jgi:exosortase
MLAKINPKLLTITILSALACYYNLLIRIYNMWLRDSRMDYIPFVMLLFGLLIKERYNKAVKYSVPVEGNWIGIPVIIVGLLFDVAGIHSSIMSFSVISIVICFSGSVILLMGFRWYRYFFLPTVLLLFLLPVPYYIESVFGTPLRLVATKISVAGLSFLGWSIKASGNVIILPAGDELVIDTACSGIRTITALLASTLFLSAFLKTWSRRFILVIVAAFTAIVTNAVRVSCLVILVMSEGRGVLDTAVHEMTGMLTFILALVAIFTAGRFINDK